MLLDKVAVHPGEVAFAYRVVDGALHLWLGRGAADAVAAGAKLIEMQPGKESFEIAEVTVARQV